MKRPLRVLALAVYPTRMAATRHRIEAYRPFLADAGVALELVTALDDDTARVMYQPGNGARLARGALAGLGRELRALFARTRPDVILLQREAQIAGPPIVEAMAMRLRIPVVLDVDDAIWLAQGGALKRALKCAWKTDWLLPRTAHVICGSEHLASHARGLGATATVVRTVVRASEWTPRPERSRGAHLAPERPVIGWIGTHSTASQLHRVAPALARLRREGRAFDVVVIGAGAGFRLPGVDVIARPWRLDTEIDDFRSIDIGLAPMDEGPWHDGKCAFKQIQYMAVGVPQISSLVGGARELIEPEVDALVAHDDESWYRALVRLLDDATLRARLSAHGRERVTSELCTEAQAPRLARILEAAASR